MIRRAFTMRLKSGAFDAYKHHHDNVWPELVREIANSGIASITTFRSGDNLFLVSEIADESAWDRLWHSDVHRRWAELMDPLMFLTDDGLVDAGELREIFHLSTESKKTPRKSAARRAAAKAPPVRKAKASAKKSAGRKSIITRASKKAAKR